MQRDRNSSEGEWTVMVVIGFKTNTDGYEDTDCKHTRIAHHNPTLLKEFLMPFWPERGSSQVAVRILNRMSQGEDSSFIRSFTHIVAIDTTLFLGGGFETLSVGKKPLDQHHSIVTAIW
jgi:hypothetical protein